MSIGMYPPAEFRNNPTIVKLYADKRSYERQNILAQRQGDAWSVMESTDKILILNARIFELQNPG